MIDGLSVLALVPARGGSKGLPGKNIIDLGGKPLLAWTLAAAAESQYIDRTVLSSDDAAIIEVAQAFGCEVPFTRPAELAQDETPAIDVIEHALTELPGFDLLVLLQPTSPLRSSEDIDRTIRLCVEEDAPSAVSVTPADKPPEWLYYLGKGQTLEPLMGEGPSVTRRQDSRPACYLNGAVYVARPAWLLEKAGFVGEGTVACELPAERAVDIDGPGDLAYAEFLLSRRV